MCRRFRDFSRALRWQNGSTIPLVMEEKRSCQLTMFPYIQKLKPISRRWGVQE